MGACEEHNLAAVMYRIILVFSILVMLSNTDVTEFAIINVNHLLFV